MKEPTDLLTIDIIGELEKRIIKITNKKSNFLIGEYTLCCYCSYNGRNKNKMISHLRNHISYLRENKKILPK